MQRTPTRRAPRVAALSGSGKRAVVIVLDPWEVRAVKVGGTADAARRLLLRERPVMLAHASRRPPPLPRAVVAMRLPKPAAPAALEKVAELRRFRGTPAARQVGLAYALAQECLRRIAEEA